MRKPRQYGRVATKKRRSKRHGKQKRAQRNRDMEKRAQFLSELFGTKKIHRLSIEGEVV